MSEIILLYFTVVRVLVHMKVKFHQESHEISPPYPSKSLSSQRKSLGPIGVGDVLAVAGLTIEIAKAPEAPHLSIRD